MRVTIVVPFPGAERETGLWAFEEERIDFRRELVRSVRCTTAFAAVELRDHLRRTLKDAEIVFAEGRPSQGSFIELRVNRPESLDCSFALAPEGNGVVVTGDGRPGVLYGAWELLRMQGWRWYAPHASGEEAPSPGDRIAMPAEPRRFAPSMTLGRGLDFAYVSQESSDLLLWMARNRLNVASYRPATGPLGRKLGMIYRMGGHIFEKILDPDRPMPTGRTMWEEHPDWYGLPADGIRRKETALAVQFCVSRPELREFLGEEVLGALAGPWQQADRVDIWGFDTWGSTCSCDSCRKLGTGTDQALLLLGSLRRFLDRARAQGRLERDVGIQGCAYEGTATMGGPTLPLPPELVGGNDSIAFYPINRCYEHDLEDPACSVNSLYRKAMEGWLGLPGTLPLTVGEYYNVSRFEDLPLLFTRCMRRDIPAFYARGARGLTYMHVPLVDWGVRTLTQWLFAQLAWDVGSDVDGLVDEYYRRWYGPYAHRMRRLYMLVEQAWAPIADWRCWGKRSVLSQLLAWDGSVPTAPIPLGGHWSSPAEAIASGRRSIALLEEAVGVLEEACREEREGADGSRRFEMRLGDDRRGLLYGLDAIRLMTEILTYHDALRRRAGDEAQAAWLATERVADRLDSYLVPISWEWPGAGVESRDALTRTQLRAVLWRCRRGRAR